MKKTTTDKKLTIKKETVAPLSPNDLPKVQGGNGRSDTARCTCCGTTR